MRIIKLSPLMGFNEATDVFSYFEETLPQDNRGRFRFTPGRIRADGLDLGEVVLFSHAGHVYYMARAASERLDNTDEWRDTLPYYFEVDLASIRRVDISLHDIEQRLQAVTGEFKHLAHSQGWPEIDNQVFEDSLWRELVG